MSLTLQNLFTNSTSRFTLHFTTTTTSNPKNTTLSLPITSRHVTTPLHSHQNQIHHQPTRLRLKLRAYDSSHATGKNDVVVVSGGNFNFDSFLSVAELLCLASSAAGLAANLAALSSSTKKAVLVELAGNKVWAWWGIVLLVGGVAIGSWIRRRQWRRICRQTSSNNGGIVEVNFLERIEKLEEDLRSSTTIIRVLSRQLEKLGIRFRVTRKSLKEPIAETAALAQKNSEATRALAAQEDILEKELGEIQKVLLAMQEQQHKQLELILAVGKAGKLWDSKREQNEEQDKIETRNSAEVLKRKETHQI